ncbi:hypothetical protein M5K25_014157 [Dendrobium thyrsiflorum]|uniref:Uncharacterized protein n=1 Tax=Dendrobium thyrsiflorum TaxID=117978 RepID=A0ABD0UV03_DENTH
MYILQVFFWQNKRLEKESLITCIMIQKTMESIHVTVEKQDQRNLKAAIRNQAGEIELSTESFSSQPLVSKGNKITARPVKNMIPSNRRTAANRWQSSTKPTATMGHIIPPIFPNEFAAKKDGFGLQAGHARVKAAGGAALGKVGITFGRRLNESAQEQVSYLRRGFSWSSRSRSGACEAEAAYIQVDHRGSRSRVTEHRPCGRSRGVTAMPGGQNNARSKDRRFIHWTGPAGPYGTGSDGTEAEEFHLLYELCKPPDLKELFRKSCSIRAPMAGRKVEVLEGEIGQLKSDCVEKNSVFKKLFSAIHEKIDEKFAIMEEIVRKILEFQIKTASLEARGATNDQGSGGNPNPIRRGKDQEVEIVFSLFSEIDRIYLKSSSVSYQYGSSQSTTIGEDLKEVPGLIRSSEALCRRSDSAERIEVSKTNSGVIFWSLMNRREGNVYRRRGTLDESVSGSFLIKESLNESFWSKMNIVIFANEIGNLMYLDNDDLCKVMAYLRTQFGFTSSISETIKTSPVFLFDQAHGSSNDSPKRIEDNQVSISHKEFVTVN